MWAVDDRFERILLESPGSLFLGPDGHGGMLAALAKSGCLADAQRRGLEHFFYGQIDNPLLQVCDELFLGSHVLAGSEMTTQVVQKRDPLERVGNVVSIDGKVQVIEYSDLPEEFARQTNPDGSLKLWAGNLAVHAFDVEFLARCSAQRKARCRFTWRRRRCLPGCETATSSSRTSPTRSASSGSSSICCRWPSRRWSSRPIRPRRLPRSRTPTTSRPTTRGWPKRR